jgi:formylglycine-generating enzyme required for sulfatase activity
MVNMGEWCIDASEVTNAAYAQFLAAKGGNTNGQPSYCTWNASFQPEPPVGGSLSCSPVPFDPINQPNHPVTCIDWCDAYAYCAWAGKRLCGRIGGGDYALEEDDPAVSQHLAACTNWGATSHPYGNAYQAGECVDDAFDGTPGLSSSDSVKPVKTGCQGSVPGVYDLVGNVWEWDDVGTSAPGPTSGVFARGGGWSSSSGTSECHAVSYWDRQDRRDFIGFRCCAP